MLVNLHFAFFSVDSLELQQAFHLRRESERAGCGGGAQIRWPRAQRANVQRADPRLQQQAA